MRSALAAWFAGVALLFGSVAASEPSLRDRGSDPSGDQVTPMLDAVCALESAANICACRGQPDRQTRVERVRTGAFTGRDTTERLVAVRGCDRRGTAVLERAGEDDWSPRRFYPRTYTRTCLAFDRTRAPELLVCHQSIASDTWRVGWVHSLDFQGGDLERRQLSSYESNARGCPSSRLRTTHPVEWRRWQVPDDPRDPLLTLRYQHRNGDVPEQYGDACSAMRDGHPTFGPRRIRTEYYALSDGRFQLQGVERARRGARGGPDSRRGSNDSADEVTVNWITGSRLEGSVCRRDDVADNVRSHRSDLASCYRRALRNSPELEGTVKLRWNVERDGSVDAIELVTDEIGDEPLRSCVRDVVAEFEFPPPRGRDRCTFVYPFRFAPKSSPASPSHTSSACRGAPEPSPLRAPSESGRSPIPIASHGRSRRGRPVEPTPLAGPPASATPAPHRSHTPRRTASSGRPESAVRPRLLHDRRNQ